MPTNPGGEVERAKRVLFDRKRCTASSRLIVTVGINPAFVKALQERMARIKVGDALIASTDIGLVSSQAQLEQDLCYVTIRKAEGATLVFGSERTACSGAEGYFMASTLFSESTTGIRINRGPTGGADTAGIASAGCRWDPLFI